MSWPLTLFLSLYSLANMSPELFVPDSSIRRGQGSRIFYATFLFFQKIYLSRVSLLSDVICFSLNSSLVSNSSSILSISFWSTQEKSHGNSGPRPREEMNIYVEQRHTSTRSVFSVKVTPESIPTWATWIIEPPWQRQPDYRSKDVHESRVRTRHMRVIQTSL